MAREYLPPGQNREGHSGNDSIARSPEPVFSGARCSRSHKIGPIAPGAETQRITKERI